MIIIYDVGVSTQYKVLWLTISKVLQQGRMQKQAVAGDHSIAFPKIKINPIKIIGLKEVGWGNTSTEKHNFFTNYQ
ncbi:hypothetical protein ACWYXD_15180 [Enterobacter roggenkampii]